MKVYTWEEFAKKKNVFIIYYFSTFANTSTKNIHKFIFFNSIFQIIRVTVKKTKEHLRVNIHMSKKKVVVNTVFFFLCNYLITNRHNLNYRRGRHPEFVQLYTIRRSRRGVQKVSLWTGRLRSRWLMFYRCVERPAARQNHYSFFFS